MVNDLAAFHLESVPAVPPRLQRSYLTNLANRLSASLRRMGCTGCWLGDIAVLNWMRYRFLGCEGVGSRLRRETFGERSVESRSAFD